MTDYYLLVFKDDNDPIIKKEQPTEEELIAFTDAGNEAFKITEYGVLRYWDLDWIDIAEE